MVNNFNLIDHSIIKNFIEGNGNVNELVRNVWYKDIYLSIYEHLLKGINAYTSYEEIIQIAYKIYISQNRLNALLEVTDGQYDRFLIGCVAGEIYERFSSINALLYKEKINLINDLIDLCLELPEEEINVIENINEGNALKKTYIN